MGFNNGVKSPCNGCSNRQLGCHGVCNLYANYKNEIVKVQTSRWDFYEEKGINYLKSKRRRVLYR